MTKALVLSGGSVKGSFQAGVIKAVVETGFIPDSIYGVSVGSLNGAFLVNEAGKRFKAKGSALDNNDWNAVVQSLIDFWTANIKEPSDVAIQRSLIGNAFHILFKNFQGLSDTTPIDKKIDEVLNVPVMMNASVKLYVGSVDMLSGNLIYSTPADTDFISYIKGSIAMPVIMSPSISKKGEVLFDGGTRDVAPLGRAINDGADDIIGILCQPKQLAPEKEGKGFSEKRIIPLVERIEDIVINQNIQNDEQWIDFINQVKNEERARNCNLPALDGYKIINHIIIQPDKDLAIDLSSFTAKDISNNIELGYEKGKAVMETRQVNLFI